MNDAHMLLLCSGTLPTVIWLEHFFAPSWCYSPLDSLKSILTSSPLLSFTVSKAGFPPYSCDGFFVGSDSIVCPGASTFPSVPASSSMDVETGWLPRKRLRISTIPRLQSRKPRCNCWHCIWRVSLNGGERHSRGVWRSIIMQSEFWRHAASASPTAIESVIVVQLSETVGMPTQFPARGWHGGHVVAFVEWGWNTGWSLLRLWHRAFRTEFTSSCERTTLSGAVLSYYVPACFEKRCLDLVAIMV